jgi:hypothetical protein
MDVANSRIEKLGRIKAELMMVKAKDLIVDLLKQQKCGNTVKNMIGNQL